MDGRFIVFWSYEEWPGNSKWIPFFLEDQLVTENAFLRGDSEVKLETWSGGAITVDLEKNVQWVQNSFRRAEDNLASESFSEHKIARCADLEGTMSLVSKFVSA